MRMDAGEALHTLAGRTDAFPERPRAYTSYVGMVCSNVRCITRATPTKEASWQQKHQKA